MQSKSNNILAKVRSVSRRTWAIVGASTALVVTIFGVAAVIGTNAANETAREFMNATNAFVEKVDAAPTSINGIKDLDAEAPSLQDHPFGWLSGDYKKAESVEVVLDVHEKEFIARAEAFAASAEIPASALEANSEYLRIYNIGVGSVDFEPRTLELFKRTRTNTTDARIEALATYKKTLEDIDVNYYSEPVRDQYISQIESAAKLYEMEKDDIRKSDSYADVRAASFKSTLSSRHPDADPVYGLYSLSTVYQQPYRMVAPGVESLKSAVKNVKAQSDETTRAAAYASLYGSIAHANIPVDEDDDTTIKRKLGVAHYALARLKTILESGTFTGTEQDMLIEHLDTAQRSVTELPFGKSASTPPSGIARATYLYGLSVDTSDYDGFSDATNTLKDVAGGLDKNTGAKFDFEALRSLRTFASDNYPQSYYGSSMSDYKRAVDRCVDARVKFHEDSKPIIDRQTELGMKANELKAELRDAEQKAGRNPSREDQATADRLRSEVNDQLAPEFESLEERSQKIISDGADRQEECLSDVERTLKTISEKSTDQASLRSSAKSAISKLAINN